MMNGKYIYSILFSLLFLLPCTSWAQGIVRCEYWFDGDIANKVENKMNGSETVNIVSKVPTAQLDDGFHQFNFRVMQSDGMYSPVLSRVFFKSAASSSCMLEYWFDDNFEKRASTELSAADEEGNVAMSLDLSDNAKFPMGNHRLHLRLTNSHGVSAVYTSSVLKLQSGKIELLEYWIDDEHSNVNYAYGKTNGNNKEFLEPLDLNGVSEGVHRLYYRGVSVDGGSSTAISSTPIMVKNRQNFDPALQKVVSYSVAVDNGEPIRRNVIDPAMEITQPHTLNELKDLKVGNHKVTVKAWNTAGAGVSVTKDFKVNKQEPPKLELTTIIEGGVVFLEMNTIPGGQDYEFCKVVRRYPRSPAEYFPIYKQQLPYPKLNVWYDVPDEAGFYTYIGRCWYYDEKREKKFLETKEIDAHVEIANKDRDKLGYVLGTFAVPLPKMGWVDVTDKEGNEVAGGYAIIDMESGTFKSPVLPVGKEVTFSINENFSDRYKYTPATVTIKAGRNDVTIEGERIDGVQPDVYDADLFFDSDISYVPCEYFKFKVRNESMRPWNGYVRARVVNKALQAKLSGNVLAHKWYNLVGTEDNEKFCNSDYDQWAVDEVREVTIPLGSLVITEKEDYTVYFETVEYGVDESKRIGLSTRKELAIESNPKVYEFEINQNGWRSTASLAYEMADLTLSTLMLQSDYFDQRFGNVRELLDQVKKGIKDAQYNESFNEEEKKWIASLDPDLYPYSALTTMISEHYRGQTHNEVKGLARVVSDVLQKNPETMRYIQEQRTEIALTLQEELGPLYHVGAGVSKIYDTWEKAKSFYNKVVGVFQSINNYQLMEPYEQFFYKAQTFISVANEILTSVSSDFAPFARILQTYVDIAEHTVAYALSNEEYAYQQEESWLMKNNNQEMSSDDLWLYPNKLNVNFRVEVRKPLSILGFDAGHISYFDFTKEEAQRQILETNIYLSDQETSSVCDIIRCSQKFDDEGFNLIPEEYVNNNAILDKINTPLKKLWMEIRWRNGRTSIIPLKDLDGKSKGVFFSVEGGAHYTVIFDSDAQKAERMADILYLAGDRPDLEKLK